MESTPLRRRWVQFGLKSILQLTLLGALAATWWLHWQQGQELSAIRDELQKTQHDADTYRAIASILVVLDEKNARDWATFRRVRHSVRWSNRADTEMVKRHVIRDADPSLVVLTFHDPNLAIPGTQSSAAVLLEDGRLADHLGRDSDTTKESNRFEVVDANHDGILDVVLQCGAGAYDGGTTPFQEIYEVKDGAFHKLPPPNAAGMP